MLIADIRTAIAADPALQALVPDSQAIADALSVGRVKFVPTDAGNGTILETLGVASGNALLDVLMNDANFRYIKPLLEQGRLRLDSALVRGTLQSLVPSVITQAQADALVARAQAPDPVSEMDVRRAIWNDDGSLAV